VGFFFPILKKPRAKKARANVQLSNSQKSRLFFVVEKQKEENLPSRENQKKGE
jgi:hypothetical protein